MIFQLEIVGKKVQNIDDFGSNRKENPINGYKIIDANILQGILAFVQNIYIMLEKNLYIYLKKINPEEVFQKNYLRTYVKSKH